VKLKVTTNTQWSQITTQLQTLRNWADMESSLETWNSKGRDSLL